jgi:hypothetical protein
LFFSRHRLFALKSLLEGQSVIEVCRSQGISRIERSPATKTNGFLAVDLKTGIT